MWNARPKLSVLAFLLLMLLAWAVFAGELHGLIG
jgi:hypothetical protein